VELADLFKTFPSAGSGPEFIEGKPFKKFKSFSDFVWEALDNLLCSGLKSLQGWKATKNSNLEENK
jgi:hypothetical protein